MRASLQRELTANLARTGGYEVISFKDYDCLMFSRGETLKMFLPKLERLWMGSPGDRRLSGEIIVAFPDAIKKLRPPSKRYELGVIIFAALIENFSGVSLHSGFVDGSANPLFLRRVAALLEALPANRRGWQTRFGHDFFEWPFGQRFEEVIKFLRGNVVFQDPPNPLMDLIKVEISMTDGGLSGR